MKNRVGDLLEIARNTWHDHAKRCRVILSGPKLPGEDLLRRPTFSDLIEVLEERGRTPATERVLAETLRHGSDEAIRDVLPLTKDWHFDDAVPLMIDRLKERVQWVIQLEHEPRLVSDAAWGLVRAAPVDPRVRRALEWLREAIRGTELTTWVDVDILIAECESHGPPRSR